MRDSSDSDAPFVASLSRAAFSRFGEYDEYLSERMREGAITRIAEVDGRAVGFAMLMRLDAEGSFDLIAIAVAPESRRLGVGRALLHDVHERALAEARDVERVTLLLHVAEVNVPARRLFESAGYRLAGVDEGFYPNGQRALSMERRLIRGEPVA